MRTKAISLAAALGASGCELLFPTGDYHKPYSDAVLADEPILYMRLGETKGSAAHDISVGHHDGTYSSGVVRGVEGAILGDDDAAASFVGGGSSGITMPEGFEFSGVAPFSVEVWVKQPAGTNRFGFAVDHSHYNPRQGWSVRFSDTSIGLERYKDDQYAGLSASAISNTPLKDNQFHHVVATFDGDKLALYVDGTVIGHGSGATAIDAVTGPWAVGRQSCSCGSDDFIGTLDELAIYDKALDASRVLAHRTAAGY